jgi:hypothetical protein
MLPFWMLAFFSKPFNKRLPFVASNFPMLKTQPSGVLSAQVFWSRPT